jgi:DNA repair protein RecO (recombination protein O)
MHCKTKAIVLKTIDFSDTAIVLKVFSRDYGLKSFLVKSVRKKKAKHNSSLFQPLTLLEIVFLEKGNDKLIIPKEINASFHFNTIPFNVYKSSMVLFLNELLYRCIHDNEPNESLFDYVENAVKTLDTHAGEMADMHLILALQMTRHLGFFPLGRFGPEKPYFKLREGVYSKYFSENDFCLDQQYAKLWDDMLEEDAVFQKPGVSSSQRQQLLEYLISYYQLHLIGFSEIKSLDVLVQLFHA